jgi:hypothetical protein
MRKTLQVVGLMGAIAIGFTSQASADSIGLVADDGCLISSTDTIFCDADIRPTGTGVFDPFLRTFRDGDQKDGTPDTYSSGWNTDAHKQDWDDPAANDAGDAWTSALALADISTVFIGLDEYYLFTVDINQEGKPGDPASLLDLVNFELFNCSTADYTDLSECAPAFDAFAADEWVSFDYRNHTGSGSGDIDVFVPTALLGPYIALRDGWGTPPGDNPDNDGYQEWAAHTGVTDVSDDIDFEDVSDDIDITPEPATLVLFGSGLALAAARLRRRKA